MPRNKNAQSNNFRIKEGLRIAIDIAFRKLLETEDLKEWEFPSSFTAVERAYVHFEARKHGVKSKSRGKGMSRYLTIYKREGSAIIERDASVNVSQVSRTVLNTLFARYPVSTKERQDCLPPVERCKDIYQDGKDTSRALGRLTIGTPQVPPPPNKPMNQFRTSLPVFSMMDTIIQTINDNPVTIIAGHTGSGKTTQVPQYILEWHERNSRPCMVICSQPRRIAAVSVAERVAVERGEKVGQTVGYQIRLEGKLSPYSVLMYCTSGVLLRSLMSVEGMLSSVTHIIIDEIHERDRLSDFMLIVLREALSKYRSLRIILMSATLDTKRFSSYFNNCPIIPVPGKQYEVKEYFLEDILKQTGYINSEMESLKKQLDKKREQKATLDKWTAAVVSDSTADLLKKLSLKSDSSNSEMDIALFDAWTNNTDSSFAQILYLIQSETVGVDYQHSETGVTALMVAAARGSLGTVEQLLSLGANIHVRSSNNYTALDWAKHVKQQEISDNLEAFALNFEQNMTAVLSGEKKNERISQADMEMLEMYSTVANDEVIDYKLILNLISHIHTETSNRGGILVFLPGYTEINALKELILMESNRLNQKTKIILLMLHSNMQTVVQRLVFKPTPPNARKVILSTNIAETSLTIEDIIYVIDTGKVKEKSYNALNGVSQLSTVWISKASALQRKGRAGRVQSGVCYHLYSTLRYEAMNQNPIPEMLRIPLSELCLFSKQLAPPNTSIVDFLMRAVDPPSIVACRSAVSLLKTIDALDTWEDLTDLGHHLLDLPVDPRYGKMLIYAVVLKCLDPILTIVCCLSHKELFTLAEPNSCRKKMANDRLKFANGSLSDHMVLLKVFQAWQESKKQGREKQFCAQNSINGANMEMVMGTRAQVLAQLRASGFIKSKAPLDIKYVNSNSDNWAVVKAALLGGLYPNLARIDREHNVIRTQKEYRVRVHVTSVLNENAVKNKAVGHLPSDWIVYEELTKVGQQSFIRTGTLVSPITVAVFGGTSKIPFDAYTDTLIEGSVGSDSEEDELEPNQTAMLKIDDWAMFRADSETAQLALQLRIKWHSLLAKKLRLNKVLNYMEEMVINTIVKVLTAEDQALGLVQPPGVGKRPYLITANTSAGRMDFNDSDSNVSLLSFDANQPNRSRMPNAVSPSKNFDRFSGMSKNYDDSSSSASADQIENLRQNCSPQVKYFLIKAGFMKNIEASMVHKMWSFTPSTQNRIAQAFKGGKNVILVFSIQGTNHFQGYAMLTSVTPVNPESVAPEVIPGPCHSTPLPIEWIKRTNIHHNSSRQIFAPLPEFAEFLAARDGQEINPNIGEMLVQLLEGQNWFNPNYQRGPRVNNRPFNYKNNYDL